MADDSFKDFVLDQLSGLPDLECKGMFGGHGLRLSGAFFACIDKGRLYFKTDETTRPAYIAAGMKTFQPMPKMALTSYYEVPPDVLEDRTKLSDWARTAAACAATGKPRATPSAKTTKATTKKAATKTKTKAKRKR